MTKGWKWNGREDVVRKLRDLDAMFNAGNYLVSVLQTIEVREATSCWRSLYGGVKAEEAKGPKAFEEKSTKA